MREATEGHIVRPDDEVRVRIGFELEERNLKEIPEHLILSCPIKKLGGCSSAHYPSLSHSLSLSLKSYLLCTRALLQCPP